MNIRIAPILVLALLGACSTDTPTGPAPIEPPAGADVVRSQNARLSIDSATPDEVRELTDANAAFAIDLYAELRDDSENVFFSPHSISVALAMTYAGAEGETERQMANALHFELPEPDLHRTMNSLDQELALRDRPAAGVQLRIVNAIWPERQYEFLPAYIDVLGENYGTGLYLLDYMTDPEGSRGTVNGWVSDATVGRIPELIPAGVVSNLTRLILTNAIYFEGSWKVPFDAADTTDGQFQTFDGPVAARMMHQTLEVPYAHQPSYQAVELPYLGDELALLAILPSDLPAFEASLSPELLAEVRSNLSYRPVDVTLPRFSIGGGRVDLKQKLQALGMVDAFGDQADFSGMDGTRELYIEAAFHQANIDVTEVGTVASGATAVIVNTRSAPPAITLDRPFLIAIVDRAAGAILFFGRIADPTA